MAASAGLGNIGRYLAYCIASDYTYAEFHTADLTDKGDDDEPTITTDRGVDVRAVES